MSQELVTLDQLQQVVPRHLRGSVDEGMVQQLNGLALDTEFREQYRDNLLSYTSVLSNGKYKIQNYVDAVRYVSHKLLGASNLDAYVKTFPDKYQRFLQDGVASKDIASYVSAYHKSKLVMAILQQTLTPSWVLNADLYQKALNVQADLMINAKSEMVRTTAASSLLAQLKAPEATKVELDIGLKQDGTIEALREATEALVAQQRAMILGGVANAQEIAHSRLMIDGEAEEVSHE